MRISILILCVGLTQVSGLETFWEAFWRVLGSKRMEEPMREMRQLSDCGKKHHAPRRDYRDLQPSNCLAACQWTENPYYKDKRFGREKVFIQYTKDDLTNDWNNGIPSSDGGIIPTDLYNHFTGFLKEHETDLFDFYDSFGNLIPVEGVNLLLSTPVIPTNVECLSDCLSARRRKKTFDLCWDYQSNDDYYKIAKCQMWANALETRNYFGTSETEYESLWFHLISKNPKELAIELCIASHDDPLISQYYKDNGEKLCGELDWWWTKEPAKKTKGKQKKKTKNKNKNRNKNKNKNIKKNRKSKKDDDKLSGSSVYLSDTNPNNEVTSLWHPWQCSLRFQGFRGRHRCGVTLLSGPTEKDPDDPFVLVGAAHCNYICKDKQTGYPLETCCCRPESVAGTCRQDLNGTRGSPFCPINPDDAEFKLADPGDLVIICGEFDADVELIWWSWEPEEVFEIVEIINHPQYKPNEDNDSNNPNLKGGPIEGNDISVYKVRTDFKLGTLPTYHFFDSDNEDALEYFQDVYKSHIWPACFPKDNDEYLAETKNRGFIAGWLDLPPQIVRDPEQLGLESFTYQGVKHQSYPRVSQLEYLQNGCQDAEWMGTNTFYPPGTVCYRDPSESSCVDFGSSGSGVVREAIRYPIDDYTGDEIQFDDNGNPVDDEGFPVNDVRSVYQYSFVGPLSMSKGCDYAMTLRRRNLDVTQDISPISDFAYRGQNPAVVTDATCFMGWIAEQYGLKLPRDYKTQHCTKHTGDVNDVNKEGEECRTSRGTSCDFTRTVPVTSGLNFFIGKTIESCTLVGATGFSMNVHFCVDTEGKVANCASNCKGVDPNSIIGGGVAAVALSGLAAQSFLGPAVGLGAVGLAGAGGVAAMGMGMFDCPAERPCRTLRGCQASVEVRGRTRCPRFRG